MQLTDAKLFEELRLGLVLEAVGYHDDICAEVFPAAQHNVLLLHGCHAVHLARQPPRPRLLKYRVIRLPCATNPHQPVLLKFGGGKGGGGEGSIFNMEVDPLQMYDPQVTDEPES